MIVIFGCGVNKVQDDTFEVKYVKSKGRSQSNPYYNVDIVGNTVHYNGIANMSILGKHSFKISRDELQILINSFDNSNFNQFNKSYKGNMRDLPITNITYNGYTISYQEEEAPEKLRQLSLLIEEILGDNQIIPTQKISE